MNATFYLDLANCIVCFKKRDITFAKDRDYCRSSSCGNGSKCLAFVALARLLNTIVHFRNGILNTIVYSKEVYWSRASVVVLSRRESRYWERSRQCDFGMPCMPSQRVAYAPAQAGSDLWEALPGNAKLVVNQDELGYRSKPAIASRAVVTCRGVGRHLCLHHGSCSLVTTVSSRTEYLRVGLLSESWRYGRACVPITGVHPSPGAPQYH